jgi:hypothetical protein
MFLVGIFLVLVVVVTGLGWLSKVFLFERVLQPAFIGALVGAAGTIFAACIAYTAARDSFEVAKTNAEDNARQRLANEKQQRLFQLQQATRELQWTRETLAFVDKFLSQFEGAAETGQRDYVAFFNDIVQTGGVIQNTGAMVDPLGARLRDLLGRFQMMQNPLNMLNGRPADQTINERATLSFVVTPDNRIIELTVEDLELAYHAASLSIASGTKSLASSAISCVLNGPDRNVVRSHIKANCLAISAEGFSPFSAWICFIDVIRLAMSSARL